MCLTEENVKKRNCKERMERESKFFPFAFPRLPYDQTSPEESPALLALWTMRCKGENPLN